MSRLITEEELKTARHDKTLRAKIKAELEERAQIGLIRPSSFYEGTVEPAGNVFARLGHQVVTQDSIRIFCDSLGIFNPLYRNPEYAINSIYGGVIAPPNYLACISTFGGEGYAMYEPQTLDYTIVSVFNAGTTGEWFRPIREGDKFSVFEVQTEVKDLTREDTTLQYLGCGKKVYKNQRDEIVAIMDMNIMMMAPLETGEVSKRIWEKKPPKIKHFSEQEIEEWYQLMVEEPIQGATPRYWEDVNVGDELPPYHQVFTTTDYLGFGVVSGCYEPTGNWPFWYDFWNYFFPGGHIDPETGITDFSIGHLQDSSANIEFLPRSYGAGAQMTCWLINLVTNWMGDTGFLKKIGNHQYRRNLWRESLVLCKGRVIKKYIEGNEHLVDLSTTLEDHNGDFQVPAATATVVLPTRNTKQLSYSV